MVEEIHIHPKVEKLLNRMETLGKVSSISARRARTIIQSLVQGIQPSCAGLLCKRKDARVSELFKFNLGSGYRLLCIREKDSVHILYVGSHDNCETWLNANRGKKPHKTEVSTNVCYVEPSESDTQAITLMEQSVSDDFYFTQISQADLKIIFKGLVDGR